jgi:hypothetical protein
MEGVLDVRGVYEPQENILNIFLEYSEYKRSVPLNKTRGPHPQQIGRAASAVLPAVTRNVLSEEWM